MTCGKSEKKRKKIVDIRAGFVMLPTSPLSGATNNNRPMKIKATCQQIGKHSLVSRDFLRKAMIAWGWNQGEADAHLIALELGKSVSIETPKGELLLEPVD